MSPQVLIAGQEVMERLLAGHCARLCLWARPVLFQGQIVQPITLLLWARSFSLSPHEGQ